MKTKPRYSWAVRELRRQLPLRMRRTEAHLHRKRSRASDYHDWYVKRLARQATEAVVPVLKQPIESRSFYGAIEICIDGKVFR